MEILENFLKNFIKADKKEWIYDTLTDDEVKELIIFLNTEDQLYDNGVDSEGNKLGSYAPLTVELKRASGQRYDHITLKDTGEFYRSWKVTVKKGDGIYITANGQKEDTNLLLEYGEDILGLTDQNLSAIVELVQERLLLTVRKEIQALIV